MIARLLPPCAAGPIGKRIPLPGAFTFAGPRGPAERVSLPFGRRNPPVPLHHRPELRKLRQVRGVGRRIRHPGSDLSWENPYHRNTFYYRKYVRDMAGRATPGPGPSPHVIAPPGRWPADGSGKPGSPCGQGIPAPAGRSPARRKEVRPRSPHPAPPAGRHRATPPPFIRIPKSGQYVLLVIVCPSDVPSSYSWRLPRSIQVCALPSHCPTVSHLAETFPPMVSTAAESARSAEPGNHVPGVNQRSHAP